MQVVDQENDPIHQVDNKWTVLFLGIIGSFVHNFIPPTVRIPPQTMPLRTLRSSSIPFYALLVVFLALLALMVYRSRRRFIEILQSAHPTNFIASVLITNIVTDAIKPAVGRLRPDFMSRCAMVNGTCTGSPAAIWEGRLSFPSGHSSTACCISIYFSLWWYQYGFGSRLQRVFLGIASSTLAVLVGVTRLLDNKHHVEDVVAGGIIGSMISLLLYYFSD